MGYEFNFSAVLTDQYIDWLLAGIRVTLLLAGGAWVLAFIVGTALAILRATGFRPAVWFVSILVEIHQNIPLLVQILFWYFAMPEILSEAWREWLNRNNSEVILAMIAIALCHAAYMSGALRSGLRAVPVTQYEAGDRSTSTTFRRCHTSWYRRPSTCRYRRRSITRCCSSRTLQSQWRSASMN